MKTLRLIRLIAQQSAFDALQYPFSFWTGMTLKLLRISLLVVFFQVIFARTPTVVGWTFDQILLLVGCYYTLDLLAKATFFRNLMFYLPQLILKGDFDQFLIRPVPLLPYVSFRKLDLLDVVNLVPVTGLLVWQMLRLQDQVLIERFPLFFVALGAGYLVLYAIAILGASAFFRLSEGEAIAWVVNELSHLARFPVTIYPRYVALSLLFVLPIGLVSLIPVGVLLGKISVATAGISISASIALFFASQLVWHSQLRLYSSASS